MQCANKQQNPPSIYEEGFTKQELKERKIWIEQFLRSARNGNDVITLLLFGLPNSGKKTFIKQLKLLYGDPSSSCIPDDLESLVIKETLALFTLIANEAIKAGVHKQIQQKSLHDLISRLSSCSVEDLATQMDSSLAADCHELWCLKEIGALYDSVPQLFPSHTQYFVSNCKRIFEKSYHPTFEDYLHFPESKRVPLEEFDFMCDWAKFRVVNVHQPNERKKWIHQFENITALLYFTDLTGCFRTLYEDDTINVWSESLHLFDELVNSRYFQDASTILFLTKRDLVVDMVLRGRADPSTTFPNYTGGCDMDKYLDWAKDQFCSVNQNYRKHVYCHFMVTTDTQNVQVIFNCCKDIMLCQSLQCCGLMDGGGSSGFSSPPRAAPPSGPSIGFAVGGAKDIVNFRKKIRSRQVPQSTDITYEGIFYEYFFDTSGKAKSVESTKLFYPSYSSAVCKNPLTQETECYLSVGLNSSMKQADFKRKKLNVIIVLDMSGSMGCSFDAESYGQTKMIVANQSVVSLLNHLDEGDSFGMIAYDDKVEEVCSQRTVSKSTDLSKLKEKILSIRPRGGTDMHKAMTAGHKLLHKFVSSKKEYRNRDEYENRLIFLTDAMPTVGYGEGDIAAYGLQMAKDSIPIFTTYIGVGIDFDTRTVQAITKIPGANYFTVQNSSEFKKRMDDEFEYMVTPLVFDLKLSIQSNDFQIDKVIGSPEADMATGELMKVNTLFPSKRTEEGAKGGVILIKLKPKPRSNENNNQQNQNETEKELPKGSPITLTSSYQDRMGKFETETQSVAFDNMDSVFTEDPQCYFDNKGIHKAVVLSHYVQLLQDWIKTGGFFLADAQREKFEKMTEYINNKAEEVEDETITQETQVLDIILSAKPAPPLQPRQPGTYGFTARKFWCICSDCDGKDQTKM